MRNCVGSAVALIALSEPSGRFFIKGGHEEERGDGWHCPPLINQHAAGNRRLVQPGSTRTPQSRAGTWQVEPSSRAACIRPQTSLLPGPILHGCTCRGLFVFPRSTQPPHLPTSPHPSCTQSTILFSSMPNYSPMISKLFDIFPNFIY